MANLGTKDLSRMPQGPIPPQQGLVDAYSQLQQQELQRRLMEMLNPPPMQGGVPQGAELGQLLGMGGGNGP